MTHFYKFNCIALALSLTLAGTLTGCGFRPVYGDITESHSANVPLSSIAIEIIPDHEGQTLRNALIDRFYQSGYPSDPVASLKIQPLSESKLELDMTKSSEATRTQLIIGTVMTLIDNQGHVLLKRDVKTVSSYNILGSEFATRVTEDNARKNAINDLARQIELNLILYYSGKK